MTKRVPATGRGIVGTEMIYVGTCGYAYKDWVGPFYPGKIKQAEMLGYYAQRFSAVEIDSSYYGVPSERTVEGMMARTPDWFRFSFKLPSTVTHPPDTAGLRVHDDVKLFRESLEPANAAKKLGAVLMQFPNGFKPLERNEQYLERVAETLEGLPVVAEFRHRDWQTPHTLELLRDLGIGWCNVDMPHFETLMHPSSDATSHVGYVRLHGRNAATWWTGTNVTRYDYEYSADELGPWTGRIADIEEQVEATYVFFNNHARGSAARNAEALEALLEEQYGPAAAEVLARAGGSAPTQPGLPGIGPT
ncbi:MAG: DUF72 domain-containing protein [Vulcanimicrobiaceae bacterium]